jgi:outer membrane protein OmpA-like peptidoglycan-associated protein
MAFCANCGLHLHEEQKFCPDCGTAAKGTPAGAAVLGPEPVTPSASAPMAASPAQTPPAAGGAGNKILIVILAVIVLGGLTAIGGTVYFGYKVKQKISETLHADETGENGRKISKSSSGENQSNSPGGGQGSGSQPSSNPQENPLGGLLGALGGGSGPSSPMGSMAKSILEDLGAKNPEMPPDLVRNMPYSTLTNPLPCPTGGQIDPAKLAAGRILFKPGTVLTESWSLPLADAESDFIIRSVSAASLVFEDSGVAAVGLDMKYKGHPDFNETVCAKDLVEGEAYATGWTVKSLKEPITPGLHPGVSRILVPITKFNELKSSGSTKWAFVFYDYIDAITEWELLAWKGTFTRVEPDDVPFPLIINDERVNVPAIHVHADMKVIETAGRFGPRDQPVDAYILDDPSTPVMLSWMMGEDMKQDDAFKVQVIRVTYPSDKPTIEQQLEKNRKAITWGINFDFNSDTIRPVSEPVLKEIAQAMVDRSGWKLTITGNTDNIGGHKYNLDLSQRRSASVKKALVERYLVDANRLSTGGEGDSAPIDTNDTLEGRARNRRVELTLD